tara:strand:- start:345 stop:821 length:477 start_codon:yes stop_codon:yes gene_type:complete
MKNFVMTAMAVALFSATANANTISVRCSDDVQRGTVKLTNPPTMNCADLELIQKYIGSGVTVGPDSKVNELVSAIENIQPAPKAQPVTEVTETPFEDGGMEIRRNELDDFTRKTFPGQNRNGNRKWFSEEKSSQCQGWIDLNDILSGKCGSVQVNMTR